MYSRSTLSHSDAVSAVELFEEGCSSCWGVRGLGLPLGGSGGFVCETSNS
jgi:hypothetical protein